MSSAFAPQTFSWHFRGWPPASWTLYHRSKSEHSTLHAVKSVLKSWRILMFFSKFILIHSFLVLSLYTCSFFFCLFTFCSLLLYFTDYTGTLAMLHIKSKLFISIWTYFWELCFFCCPLFSWCLSFFYQHIFHLVYQTPDFFLNPYFPFVCIIWIM